MYTGDTTESRLLWEEIAEDWDAKMGEQGNAFHREIIRPATLKLLNPASGEHILDISCGNGIFAGYLAKLGVRVTAFDYSERMIGHANKRCAAFADLIDFHVIDATDYNQLMKLKSDPPFDKAVSNMAIMDIADIKPLFKAVYELLSPEGIFVFSGVHPCFQTPKMRTFTEIGEDSSVRTGIQTCEYIRPKPHKVTILSGNSKQAFHYHRPLSMILNLCFEAGFVLDGVEEPVFERTTDSTAFDWYEIPPAIILRMRKG